MVETFTEKECLENFVLDSDNLLEKLEDKLAGLNIFEAIGMHTQEIRHSATLAFLLDPQKPHGLGQYFLKKFLKNIAKIAKKEISTLGPIDIDCADFSDVEVRCEWRRIDVLIVCRSAKIVVAIENKIKASEHGSQLKRYKETVDAEWKDFHRGEGFHKLFVFLTVDGEDPIKKEGKKTWVSYSHEDLVKLLESSLKTNEQNLGRDQEVLIRHYIELMRRRVLGNSDIAKLAQNIYQNHKQAIDLIIEHKPDTRAEIASYLSDLIRGSGLKMAPSTKTYTRFYPEEWTFGKDWVGQNKDFNNLGVSFEIEISRSLKNLQMVLLIPDLKSPENKEYLWKEISKNLDFKETMIKGYPRVWRFKKLDLTEDDILDSEKLFKRIDKWWDDFKVDEKKRVCETVLKVLVSLPEKSETGFTSNSPLQKHEN